MFVFFCIPTGSRMHTNTTTLPHTLPRTPIHSLTDEDLGLEELRARPYRVLWLVNNVEFEDFPRPDKARRAFRAVPFSAMTPWMSPADTSDHRLALMIVRQDGIVSKRRGAELVARFGTKAMPPTGSAASVVVGGGSLVLEMVPGAEELAPDELELMREREKQLVGQPMEMRWFDYLEALSPRKPWVVKPLPRGGKPVAKAAAEVGFGWSGRERKGWCEVGTL